MIKNRTKNIILSTEEINANTFLKQARGLMFKSKQNCLMTFKNPKKISLHNFFVFYPLDILIINSQNQIVEIKQNFRPFTFWSSTEKGKHCLELAITNTTSSPAPYHIGDEIEINLLFPK